jgi:hypothetical protein
LSTSSKPISTSPAPIQSLYGSSRASSRLVLPRITPHVSLSLSATSTGLTRQRFSTTLMAPRHPRRTSSSI